jgi:tripartite-type tricarboxylate transporter receptor subunit TctC
MKKLLTALVPIVLSLAAITAQAQAWPTAKPVNLMVPFPPGGSTDMIARTLSTKLQESLGGTFIVQNTSGAGGTVGACTATVM